MEGEPAGTGGDAGPRTGGEAGPRTGSDAGPSLAAEEEEELGEVDYSPAETLQPNDGELLSL